MTDFAPYYIKKGNWTLIFSVGALLVSFACYFIKREPISFDYMAGLVGILSILVTALIGFQIYNSIAIADKLKEYERGANKAALKEVEKYSHSVKSYVYTFLAIDLINQNGDERAIANLMIAVDEGRKGTDEDALTLAIHYLEKIINARKKFSIKFISYLSFYGSLHNIKL